MSAGFHGLVIGDPRVDIVTGYRYAAHYRFQFRDPHVGAFRRWAGQAFHFHFLAVDSEAVALQCLRNHYRFRCVVFQDRAPVSHFAVFGGVDFFDRTR
ncbi:hypothetical protein D3C79_1005980 [compost metagenome]